MKYFDNIYIGVNWKRVIWNQILRHTKREKRSNRGWSKSTEVFARLWYSLTKSSQYEAWKNKPEVKEVLEMKKGITGLGSRS